MKRIIGIDYGDVRVGVSVSDPLKITAQGLDTIVINNNDNIFFKEIKKLSKKYDTDNLVIGYPINMDGSLSKKAIKVNEIIEKLQSIGFNVDKIDERLTTVSSYNTMRELGIKQKEKNKYADKFAAMYILQNYLDKFKEE